MDEYTVDSIEFIYLSRFFSTQLVNIKKYNNNNNKRKVFKLYMTACNPIDNFRDLLDPVLFPIMSKPRKTIRVLVDMDGVVANCEQKILENYTKLHPKSPVLPQSERKGLYMDRQYHEKFGEHIGDLVYNVLCEPGFFASIEPIQKAVDTVKRLIHDPRFQVFFCTSPMRANPTCCNDKMDWITRYFGKQLCNRVIITSDKTVCKGDVLIDDKIRIMGAESEPDWVHILCRASYNKHISTDTHPFILEDWDSVEKVIDDAVAYKDELK